MTTTVILGAVLFALLISGWAAAGKTDGEDRRWRRDGMPGDLCD